MRFISFVLLVFAIAAALAVVGVDAKVKVTETKKMTEAEKQQVEMHKKRIAERLESQQKDLRKKQAKTWPEGDKQTPEAKARVRCETCQMVTHIAMLEMWNHYNEHEDTDRAREVGLEAALCESSHQDQFRDQFRYSPTVLKAACKKLVEDGTSSWYESLQRMAHNMDPAKDRDDNVRDLTKPAYVMTDLWETQRSRITMCNNAAASPDLGLCDPKTNMGLSADAGLWEKDEENDREREQEEQKKVAAEAMKKKQASDKKFRDRKARARAKRKAAKAKKYADGL